MALDLEALYEHYRALDLSEGEAAERAEAKLLASPEALRHLIEVHTTSYQRLVSRVAGRMRWGFDLFLFLVGVAPLVIVSAKVMATDARGTSGGFILWTLLACGAAIVLMGSWKAVQIFVRGDRSTAALNRGLFSLLFLALIGPLLGSVGFLLSIHRIGIELGSTSTAAAGSMRIVAREVVAGGTVFTVGILVAIASASVWFVLVNRVTDVEQAESAALLGS